MQSPSDSFKVDAEVFRDFGGVGCAAQLLREFAAPTLGRDEGRDE